MKYEIKNESIVLDLLRHLTFQDIMAFDIYHHSGTKRIEEIISMDDGYIESPFNPDYCFKYPCLSSKLAFGLLPVEFALRCANTDAVDVLLKHAKYSWSKLSNEQQIRYDNIKKLCNN